tara:strand:- start:1536 stop:1775 length:240 start_codon:yes stop_codon:yes gene_type:complete
MKKSPKIEKGELDLHGVRHDDVERIVENFVLLNEPPLTIITGNSDKMSHIVEVTLNKLRIGWERFAWGEIKILDNTRRL